MLIPATRYHDCETALAFIRDVLGLTEHAVFRDDEGHIVHAQMRLGRGMMMFGPPQGGEFDRLMVAPAEIGNRETTTIYAVVADVAVLHARIAQSGATIVMPLKAQDHGGSSFSVADPEGHVWTFGDYDPLAGAG